MTTHTCTRDHQPALHNCGPGPASVYRTAPAGSVYLLDLYTELQGCNLLAKPLRASFTPQRTQYDDQLPMGNEEPAPPAPAASVVRLLSDMLAQLDVHDDGRRQRRQEDSGDDALRWIEYLKLRLEELGCLVPVNALVKWQPRTPFYGAAPTPPEAGYALPWMPEPPAHLQSDRMRVFIRLAWIICVVSHAAPPIVLFNRTPSLRYWRADGMLSLRWLGSTEVRP